MFSSFVQLIYIVNPTIFTVLVIHDGIIAAYLDVAEN
jgi:hypothetical protein